MTVLKSIVLCLVLANVGYFLWVRGMTKSPDAEVAATTPATLKLASEAAGRGAHRRHGGGSAAAIAAASLMALRAASEPRTTMHRPASSPM